MLEEIKKELLNNPEILREVLEEFGYSHIVIRPKYMQFGRDDFSSKKAIVIKLEKNNYLYLTDYARNINCDLITYIINQRHVSFSEVLSVIRNKLHITDYYELIHKKRGIFGGFYNNIRIKNSFKVNTYSDDILNQYQRCSNARFLRDRISLEVQKYFGIGYDTESQCITIPIRDQFGSLMGVKGRCNWEVEDGDQKYFYLVPCSMSQTLFGYSQNYGYLTDNTVYIFESEKSVLQCYSYGIKNCVALGSGSISKQQIKMLLELNPTGIVFMHDVGFDIDNIMRNIHMVQSYSRFSEVELGYWDYFNYDYSGKFSPSDFGKSKLIEIINNEIKMIGEDDGQIC